MTLVVNGYNNDPRELVDIPEVRAMLRQREATWPHWAYFFNQVDDSIKLLLSCVAGASSWAEGRSRWTPIWSPPRWRVASAA